MTEHLYQIIQDEGTIWIGVNKSDDEGIPIVQGLFRLEMNHISDAVKERLLLSGAQTLVNLANETLILRNKLHE